MKEEIVKVSSTDMPLMWFIIIIMLVFGITVALKFSNRDAEYKEELKEYKWIMPVGLGVVLLLKFIFSW